MHRESNWNGKENQLELNPQKRLSRGYFKTPALKLQTHPNSPKVTSLLNSPLLFRCRSVGLYKPEAKFKDIMIEVMNIFAKRPLCTYTRSCLRRGPLSVFVVIGSSYVPCPPLDTR